MATLKQWILGEIYETNETIEAVVIGESAWGDFTNERIPNFEQQPKHKTLSWEEAAPWLDYEFDDGFGAPGCNAIYVWTDERVFFVAQYDGATKLCCVPRSPVNCKPEMPGG